MVLLFYTTFISVDLAHQVIFHAKVGKGGINLKKDTAHHFSSLSSQMAAFYIHWQFKLI